MNNRINMLQSVLGERVSINATISECLLYTKHFSRLWGGSYQYNKVSAFRKLIFSQKRQHTKDIVSSDKCYEEKQGKSIAVARGCYRVSPKIRGQSGEICRNLEGCGNFGFLCVVGNLSSLFSKTIANSYFFESVADSYLSLNIHPPLLNSG